MDQTTAEPETTTAGAPQGVQDRTEFAPITSQDELNKLVGERIARERAKFADYSDLKAKAVEFDKLHEQSKTEQQKAIERAERAEKELADERLASDRRRAADEAGIPASMAGRLVGSTPEELAADAKELAQALAPRTPRPVPVQSGATTTNSGDWLRSRLANKS